MKLQRPDPGIDAAKSGLHGKAGIFFNAGLLEKGEPRFDLQDLDPYLVFDSRESMLGTLENPTLDLDPATPSTLDVITATRAGVATYTDADGLIATASADTVRVDYTQGAELTPTVYQRIGYTDFSSGWYASNGATITGTGSYNGSTTKEITAVGYSIYYNLNVPTIASKNYNVSFYARLVSGSSSSISIYRQHTETAFTSISLTSDWQRFDVAVTASGAAVNFGIAKTAGTDPAVFEISQPQFTEGSELRDFVANTTGSPKFITGATYGPRVPMILVEPSATNTIRWSESSSAYTYGGGMTTESTEVLAPNGQASAFKMTPNDTSTTHRWGVLNGAGSWNADDVITYSVWVKTDGYDYILNLGGFFGGEATTFDTLDGSVIGSESNVISASSEDYGNGWFRYVVTYTFQNTITNNYVYAGIRLYKRDASGNATNWDATGETTGVLVYGSQFESGSVATSYIPTDNDISGVTRAADDLVISGSDFSDFFNNSEGTIYCEFEYDFEHAYEYIYNIRQDASNEIRTQLIPTNNIRTRYTVADSHIAQLFPAGVVQGSLNRHVFSYKTNNFRGNVNGGSDDEELSGNASLTPVEMQLGGRGNGIFNIKLKRLIYWPYHSDNL